MKLSLIALSFFALLLGHQPASAANANDQLVLNNEFVAGMANWYVSSGLVVSATDSDAADKAVVILRDDNSLFRQDLTKKVTKGASYQMTARTKLLNGNGKSQMIVSIFDAGWNLLDYKSVPLAAGNQFAIQTINFTVPQNAASVRVFADHRTGAPMVVDSISVLPVAKVAEAPKADPNKLKFAPPKLVNPITLELGDGMTTTRLKDNQDYIIKLPRGVKKGSTYLLGGHNVVLIGGHIALPATDEQRRAIYIKDNKGTVHIEGVFIDGSSQLEMDAIDISAPESTVQIQNVRVIGIRGTYSGFHADVVQPFGGVKKLLIDKLTGASYYQGLQLNQDYAKIEGAVLSRINLKSLGAQIWGVNNNGGFLLWLIRAEDCSTAYPVELQDVFVQQRIERPITKAVWPPADTTTACGSAVSADGKTASFPKLPVKGVVNLGAPAADFVPDGVAGINYVSPGYL